MALEREVKINLLPLFLNKLIKGKTK